MLPTTNSIRLADWLVMNRLVAALLSLRTGSVWCPRCNEEHSAEAVRLTPYELDLGALSGGAGRRFACPSDHELLDVVNRRS